MLPVSESDSTSGPLRQSLAKLHAQLSGTTQADGASKQLLRDVLVDIERLLQDEKQVAHASTSKLEALAVRFDSDHPSLSASLRQFIDLLGRAGI
jgi:Domain of unknown function (DUF4404)